MVAPTGGLRVAAGFNPDGLSHVLVPGHNVLLPSSPVRGLAAAHMMPGHFCRKRFPAFPSLLQAAHYPLLT